VENKGSVRRDGRIPKGILEKHQDDPGYLKKAELVKEVGKYSVIFCISDLGILWGIKFTLRRHPEGLKDYRMRGSSFSQGNKVPSGVEEKRGNEKKGQKGWAQKKMRTSLKSDYKIMK